MLMSDSLAKIPAPSLPSLSRKLVLKRTNPERSDFIAPPKPSASVDMAREFERKLN